jgi:FAD/FMN-containing dehydrogenase
VTGVLLPPPDLHLACIPAIARLHGCALCCWQVTPAARRTAAATGLDGARSWTRPRGGTGWDPGTAAARPAVYGARAGERLTALKRRYDPDNVFRLNHNITP